MVEQDNGEYMLVRDHNRFLTHISHCNFGEHAGQCKYGDGSKCPALHEDWSWIGEQIQKLEDDLEMNKQGVKYESDVAEQAIECMKEWRTITMELLEVMSENITDIRKRVKKLESD